MQKLELRALGITEEMARHLETDDIDPSEISTVARSGWLDVLRTILTHPLASKQSQLLRVISWNTKPSRTCAPAG